MKVYISADMEGITGLVDAEDVQPHGRDYEHGRVMMTEDVNAAVRGAVRAGATTIVVNDAHKPMRNLLPDRLDPAARLVRGGPKPMGMLEGLDGSFDALVCIGFHARAGTSGVLSHSFMGREIEDIWLDGRLVGEIGLLHATAAAMGVPLVMLSGDDAACAETTEWDAGVATVAVKRTRDRFAAELDPVAEARGRIEAAVLTAVRAGPGGGRVPPAAEAATLAVRWQSTSVASHLAGIPGVTRRDDRTVEVSGPMTEVFRLFGIFLRVATALTGQPPYC
ncbi:M55 family metallopeptidase [Actinomadura scrupuli]|uniref:M55 family metallopeptidase n=1 Tax=Actinomadura scrupuli TaxID=559629 RepID=UPI003D96186B